MTEIAVVGAGTMGHAPALVFGLGAHQVRLTDADPATLARAAALMRGAVETGAETVRGAAIVIEAIVERADIKRALRDIEPLEGT